MYLSDQIEDQRLKAYLEGLKASIHAYRRMERKLQKKFSKMKPVVGDNKAFSYEAKSTYVVSKIASCCANRREASMESRIVHLYRMWLRGTPYKTVEVKLKDNTKSAQEIFHLVFPYRLDSKQLIGFFSWMED